MNKKSHSNYSDLWQLTWPKKYSNLKKIQWFVSKVLVMTSSNLVQRNVIYFLNKQYLRLHLGLFLVYELLCWGMFYHIIPCQSPAPGYGFQISRFPDWLAFEIISNLKKCGLFSLNWSVSGISKCIAHLDWFKQTRFTSHAFTSQFHCAIRPVNNYTLPLCTSCSKHLH